jgi:uncharacterized protein (DUF58 family)
MKSSRGARLGEVFHATSTMRQSRFTHHPLLSSPFAPTPPPVIFEPPILASTFDLDPREMVAPAFLASVEDLELVARWVVEGFLQGLHQSPYVGFSVEFASHREYLPGDDLRHLNWKLYGRHDRLYIKQYDAETNVELRLVLDVSGSMTAGEGPLSKLRYASMLCAALSHLAARQRDAVGLTLFADRVVEHLSPRNNPDHRMEILYRLATSRAHPAAANIDVLHEAAELAPRRGLVAVISDLFYDPEETLSALAHYRSFGHDVIVFHLLSPLERGMSAEGAVRFRDLETNQEIVTQAHEIRAAFTAAIDHWMQTLQRGCTSREIDYVPITTDTPLEQALFEYFVKRSQLM